MDSQSVISTLNDLIETCKDGEYGFRMCAEKASSPNLASLLGRHADECQAAARELQQCVVQLGETPDTSGSVTGALHRGWVAVRSVLSSYDDEALLAECERGEDTAVAAYRKALEKPLPETLRAVVERQYLGARRNHDQVRSLRGPAH
ncbi:PA2169 family four-helix-bundle protein [Uliginosibacterium paludis]|uniref:PA2169 family four-helix-bundle protein n=1 Tax=Uliginosibacterium paludis TaxID=1615952 RepID=A0ABV2CT30_9RHOO